VYENISGLSPELVSLAIVPTMILSLVPGLETVIAWRHGLLVDFKQTRVITRAIALNVAVLISVMLGMGALLPKIPGTTMAAIAQTSAVAGQWVYLWWYIRPIIADSKAPRGI